MPTACFPEGPSPPFTFCSFWRRRQRLEAVYFFFLFAKKKKSADDRKACKITKFAKIVTLCKYLMGYPKFKKNKYFECTISITCADPGIFFRGGWGGGGGGCLGLTTRKQSGQSFFGFFFPSPQPILQFTEGVQWFYYRENYTFQGSRGGPTFSRGGGGGPTFSRGVQMLISIETHITCDFPGGGGPDPLSPLWIRTCITEIVSAGHS